MIDPLSPRTIPRAAAVVPLTVIVSEFAPPATTLYPDPTVTVSVPPTSPLRLETTVVPVGVPLPFVSTSRRPSSASTKLRPAPSDTVSLPAPAITLFTPLLRVIVSLPPTPRLIDSIRRRFPFAKKVALPSSPRIVFVPLPAVIWSAPAPPMTVFVPFVKVIESAAPLAKSVLSIDIKAPALVICSLPLSPRTMPRAFDVVPFTTMLSDAAPPTTTL